MLLTDASGRYVTNDGVGSAGSCPTGGVQLGSPCEPVGTGGSSGGSWTPTPAPRSPSTSVPAAPAPLGSNPVAPAPTTTPTPLPAAGPNVAHTILGDVGGVAGAATFAGRLPGPAVIAGGICIGLLTLAVLLLATQVQPLELSIPQPAPTPEERSPVRVQLQEGKKTYTTQRLNEPKDGGGVTVAQVVSALTILRADPSIPKGEQKNADAAFAAAVNWASTRPPYGVTALVKKSFPFDKNNPTNNWRFDIDVLVGTHLKR